MTLTGSKTFKYKLEPTPEQAKQMTWVLDRCRELYNAGLRERRDAWKMQRVSISYYDQTEQLPGIKEVRPEYQAIHSQVLQDTLRRLDKAMQAFFRRVKLGDKPGYPRFQGRKRYHSFTYPQYDNGARCDNGFLVLSKIGRMKVRWSRPLQGTPKTVTISNEADGWYVCFSCTDVPCVELVKTGQEVGIDVGLTVFQTTSEGDQCANPRWLRKMEKKLRYKQKQVSRRQKGSNRRQKAVNELAQCHQTVARQREDFHHKEANKLIRQYDVIYVEDLQVANMVRNRHLSKSISDAGWAQYRSILQYKAAYAGKEVVAVPPHYTSQDCSRCHNRVHKSLSVRTHICPYCGLVMDRDENGAKNVKWAGQALRGAPRIPGTVNRESIGL